jgi:hypothetical protein
MVAEFPEKEVRVIFRKKNSTWAEAENRVIEYNELYWSTGQITWEEINTKWWEEEEAT